MTTLACTLSIQPLSDSDSLILKAAADIALTGFWKNASAEALIESFSHATIVSSECSVL